MSSLFGVYLTLIGLAVVFATLLLVSALTGALRRLVERRDEGAGEDRENLMRVAIAVAVHYYTSQGAWSPPEQVVPASISRWAHHARIESMRHGRVGGEA